MSYTRNRGFRRAAAFPIGVAPKQTKYLNRKCEMDGYTFDSQKEMNRYLELKMLRDYGKITDLVLQPRFKILDKVVWEDGGKTLRSRYYVADFKYTSGDETIVEDVKSAITAGNPVYTLKRHLFLAQYGESVRFIEK